MGNRFGWHRCLDWYSSRYLDLGPTLQRYQGEILRPDGSSRVGARVGRARQYRMVGERGMNQRGWNWTASGEVGGEVLAVLNSVWLLPHDRL